MQVWALFWALLLPWRGNTGVEPRLPRARPEGRCDLEALPSNNFLLAKSLKRERQSRGGALGYGWTFEGATLQTSKWAALARADRP